MTDAWEAAMAGASEAADHADAFAPGWSDKALDLFQRFAEARGGEPFLVEDARAFAAQEGLGPPPDNRAWGAVAQRAKRAGLVERAGYGSTTRRPAHTHPAALWRLTRRAP